MGRHFQKSGGHRREWYDGAHRFEHWYRDRTVYLVTARVRDRLPIFLNSESANVFWSKLLQYTTQHGFELWIATLMSNHYHFIGFLERGSQLGEMMRKLHGSVAWLTCRAHGIHHKPFWRDDQHRDYFDGCLRDARQLRRSYRYVQQQAVRAGLVQAASEYPNTRCWLTLEACLRLAQERDAFLADVAYARYKEPDRKRGRTVDP